MAIPDPGFVFIEEIDRAVLQTEPQDGPIFTGKRRETHLRRFRLNYPRMTKVQADQLRTQFADAKGTVASFTWTPGPLLEVSPVTVKFAKDQTLSIEWVGPNHYRAACVLEELLRPTA